MTKIAGSGFISHRHGSADPYPDPHQNVMDPQRWKIHRKARRKKCNAQKNKSEFRVLLNIRITEPAFCSIRSIRSKLFKILFLILFFTVKSILDLYVPLALGSQR
jgi:hypothetical protein